MSNLTVENLSRSVATGDIEKMMGGGVQAPVAPEGAVVREMQAQGMQPGPIEGGGDGAGLSGVSGADGGGSFSDVLRKSFDQVNTDQHQADSAIKELVAGRTKNIHETMLTIERADTSLKLMMQVRNKVLDAYREIMRMQV
jgi:flagellar hook-basal body complex protein FliE